MCNWIYSRVSASLHSIISMIKSTVQEWCFNIQFNSSFDVSPPMSENSSLNLTFAKQKRRWRQQTSERLHTVKLGKRVENMLGNLLTPWCNELVSSYVPYYAIHFFAKSRKYFFFFLWVQTQSMAQVESNITATLNYSLQYTCSEKAKWLANPHES